MGGKKLLFPAAGAAGVPLGGGAEREQLLRLMAHGLEFAVDHRTHDFTKFPAKQGVSVKINPNHLHAGCSTAGTLFTALGLPVRNSGRQAAVRGA